MNIAGRIFPNRSLVTGYFPHHLKIADNQHQRIIAPDDRVLLKLGCPSHRFDTFEELISYISDPGNDVTIGVIAGGGHACDVVVTDSGIKIADAQQGLIYDPAVWLKELFKSADQTHEVRRNGFELFNIAEHDPRFSLALYDFEKDMERLCSDPAMAEHIKMMCEVTELDDPRDIGDFILNGLTDSYVLNRVQWFSYNGLPHFEDVGFRYCDDDQAINTTLCELPLAVGEWVIARDNDNSSTIYMGAGDDKVLCIRQNKSQITTKDSTELHVLASSSKCDLSHMQRSAIARSGPHGPSTLEIGRCVPPVSPVRTANI